MRMESKRLTDEHVSELLKRCEDSGLDGVAYQLRDHIAALSVPTPEGVAKDYALLSKSLRTGARIPGEEDALARLGDGAARAKALEAECAALNQHLARESRTASAAIEDASAANARATSAALALKAAEAERDAARQDVMALRKQLVEAAAERDEWRCEADTFEILTWRLLGAGLARAEAAERREAEWRTRALDLSNLVGMYNSVVRDLPKKAQRPFAAAGVAVVGAHLLNSEPAVDLSEKTAAMERYCKVLAQHRPPGVKGEAPAALPATAPLVETVRGLRAEDADRLFGEVAQGTGPMEPEAFAALGTLRDMAEWSTWLSPAGAAHDAAKGGETPVSYVPQDVATELHAMLAAHYDKPGQPNTLLAMTRAAMDDARKWDVAVERAKDRDALHRSWYGLNVKEDVVDRAVRYVLGLDTPPSGPGGGVRHPTCERCGRTFPGSVPHGGEACDVPLAAAPLTLETLAAVCAQEEAEVTHSLDGPPPPEDWPAERMRIRTEGARALLRRATNGQVPRVLLAEKVVEVLAQVGEEGTGSGDNILTRSVVRTVARCLGLTLPDATTAECARVVEREGFGAAVSWARHDAAATHHGEPDAQQEWAARVNERMPAPREAPVEPVPEGPPVYEAVAFGTKEQADTAEREFRTGATAVAWEGDGVRVLANGTAQMWAGMEWRPMKGIVAAAQSKCLSALARAVAEAKRNERKAAEDMRERAAQAVERRGRSIGGAVQPGPLARDIRALPLEPTP